MALDPTRVKAVFQAATEIGDEGERAAFLDRECGADTELRARVEALLGVSRNSASTVEAESPTGVPLDATIEYQPIKEGIGTVIGPYKLLQKLGEGGFGARRWSSILSWPETGRRCTATTPRAPRRWRPRVRPRTLPTGETP